MSSTKKFCCGTSAVEVAVAAIVVARVARFSTDDGMAWYGRARCLPWLRVRFTAGESPKVLPSSSGTGATAAAVAAAAADEVEIRLRGSSSDSTGRARDLGLLGLLPVVLRLVGDERGGLVGVTVAGRGAGNFGTTQEEHDTSSSYLSSHGRSLPATGLIVGRSSTGPY